MKEESLNVHINGQGIDGQCNPEAWLRFVRDTRWSVLQKHKLLVAFSYPERVYQATEAQLASILGQYLKRKTYRVTSQMIQHDMDWLKQPEHALVCYGSRFYPELLTQLPDPPIALFCKGDIGLLAEPKVAMVGSRRPSPLGVTAARKIGSDLSGLGIVVVSGMALGIDAVAHSAALDSQQSTIAVMGSGLDIISPARHRGLFQRISDHGLLLSEYPLGYPASRYTFPQRNRIVSGLSYGVVVIEAANKSGTLITARLAVEQNREVFVVPGPALNPQYQGSHDLIRQGANLITDVNDILHALAVPLQSSIQLHQDSKHAMNDRENHPLLSHIGYEPTPIDAIILSSGLTASEVSSMLLTLEVNGEVTVFDGGYTRVR